MAWNWRSHEMAVLPSTSPFPSSKDDVMPLFRHPGFGASAAAAGALVSLLLLHPAIAAQARDTLPASLSNNEFWALTEQLSEPDGYFRSNSGSPDNLLSNENEVSSVAGALAERVKPSGVYLGVGPEQNFTYIAAMRPRIAFITDIRRGNLHLHLMYKALFEMSSDRADFVGRLFSRKRPADLPATPSAAELMGWYLQIIPGTEETFKANLKDDRRSPDKDPRPAAGRRRHRRHRIRVRQLPSIRSRHQLHVVHQWPTRDRAAPYARIMSAIDGATGQERTYLANETNFELVKSLHDQESDRAGRRRLRGTESAARGRRVSQSARGDRERVLCVERRVVFAAQRRLGSVLCERREPAARRGERVHPARWPEECLQPDGG